MRRAVGVILLGPAWIGIALSSAAAEPADPAERGWLVERRGGPTALASPLHDGAPRSRLAAQLHLDDVDAERWSTPVGEGFEVPNTSVVVYGVALDWDAPYPWVFAALKAEADRRVAEDRAAGHHVVVMRAPGDAALIDGLASGSASGQLARFAFVGHGDRGLINTTGQDDAGVPPQAYTRYGLADLTLWTCGGLAPSPYVVPFIDDAGSPALAPHSTASLWQHNVAVNGRLRGYRRDSVRPWSVRRLDEVAGLRPRQRP